jgi:CRISPR/Cas system-associated protein Csm6
MKLNLSELQTGDIVRCSIEAIPFLIHIGFVVRTPEGIYIYHLTPTSINRVGGSVVRESLFEFLQGRKILKVVKSGLTADEIIGKCVEIADKKYELINFNCEHFAHFVLNIKNYSPQVNKWSLILENIFNSEDFLTYS